MNTKELIAKVRRLEIRSRGLTNQIFGGQYHSAFKGRGMAFSEVRDYVAGDDVRNIDWNVTARFDTPFMKVFEEERELVVMLLIDVSASSAFGTRSRSKKELINEIAATLTFSAISNRDKIGVVFFSDRVEKFLPPKSGRGHALRVIRELIDLEPKGKGTDLSEALRFTTNLVTKRSTCLILSDFLCADFKKDFKVASNKHDMLAIQVMDPAEYEMPNIGLVRIKDPESDQTRWLHTGLRSVRNTWNSDMQRRKKEVETLFKKTATDHVTVRTDEDFVPQLTRLLRRGA